MFLFDRLEERPAAWKELFPFGGWFLCKLFRMMMLVVVLDYLVKFEVRDRASSPKEAAS